MKIMTLTGKQKNYLRGLAHSKHPIVSIGGKGLTEAVLKELDLALQQHELVKIKLPGNDKSEKAELMERITALSGSESVQLIGGVGVVYRAAEEPKITLPST